MKYKEHDDRYDRTHPPMNSYQNNSSPTETSCLHRIRWHLSPDYLLGLSFIVLVSVIWSASSVLVQYLDVQYHFESPFLVTYMGVSLFVFLLPLRFLLEWWNSTQQRYPYPNKQQRSHTVVTRRLCPVDPKDEYSLTCNHDEEEEEEEDDQKNHRIREEDNLTNGFHYNAHSSFRYAPSLQEQDYNNNQDKSEMKPEHEQPVDNALFLSHAQHRYMALRIAPVWFLANYMYNLSLISTSITSSTVLASTGSVFTFLFSVFITKNEPFTMMKLVGVGFAFLGSCITSLSDVSVSSTSTSFSSWTELWGDMAGLFSAVGYGAYTVLLKTLCPKDESLMSMQLLLGYIGLLNFILLSPIAIGCFYFGYVTMGDSSSGKNRSLQDDWNRTLFFLEPFHSFSYDSPALSHSVNIASASFYHSSSWNTLSSSFVRSIMDETSDPSSSSSSSSSTAVFTWPIFLCLLGKGLTDNVLSDYLWARAVLLTSATVATVGLGLTIPLAFLSDAFMLTNSDPNHANGKSHQQGEDDDSHKHPYMTHRGGQIWGAFFVLIGFILVNVGNKNEGDFNVNTDHEDEMEFCPRIQHEHDPEEVNFTPRDKNDPHSFEDDTISLTIQK